MKNYQFLAIMLLLAGIFCLGISLHDFIAIGGHGRGYIKHMEPIGVIGIISGFAGVVVGIVGAIIRRI
jgi:FtsH-binding integral membrane protein